MPPPSAKPGPVTDLLSTPGVVFNVNIADPTERVQNYIEAYRHGIWPNSEDGFDDKLMRDHLSLLSASCEGDRASATFLIKAGPSLFNRIGTIHGGAVALIYDMCTTMCAAPLAKKGYWEFGGVSRNLSVTYLRPARSDMDIVVECHVLQMGARLATIRGQMRDRASGKLLSVAEHTKASLEAYNFTSSL